MYDPNFSSVAEQERALYVAMAQVAMNKGDINGYMSAVKKVREMETMILTQQLMVGVDEAVKFGSAQRLSQVMSMVYTGRDVVVVPKGNGLGDIYMDGKLEQSDADLLGVSDQLLRMIDKDYRAQAAASEAERAKTTSETDEAIRQQTAIDAARIAAEDEVARKKEARAVEAAIEQAYGVGLAQLKLEAVKAEMIKTGKLPGKPEDYEYKEVGMSDGSTGIAVLSGGRQVALYATATVTVNGKPQLVVTEIKE